METAAEPEENKEIDFGSALQSAWKLDVSQDQLQSNVTEELGLEALSRMIAWKPDVTREQIQVAQKKDLDIGPIKRAVEGGSKPIWEEISDQSAILKTYWGSWELLEVKGGLLYRKLLKDTGEPERMVALLPWKY